MCLSPSNVWAIKTTETQPCAEEYKVQGGDSNHISHGFSAMETESKVHKAHEGGQGQ